MRASQTLRHPMPQRRFLASLGLPFARMGARLISSPADSDAVMALGRTPLCGCAIDASSTWPRACPGNFTSCGTNARSLRPFELTDARWLRKSVRGEVRQAVKSINEALISYGRSTARRRRYVRRSPGCVWPCRLPDTTRRAAVLPEPLAVRQALH